MFELPDPAAINHLVVFLLAEPFPVGYAATVYFQWPGSDTPQWVLLGMLSNEKPSAIFRLGGKKTIKSTAADQAMIDDSDSMMPSFSTYDSANVCAQLGISVEPMAVVMQQISTLPTGQHSLTQPNTSSSGMDLVIRSNPQLTNVEDDDFISIALKLLENFSNHCQSFAVQGLPSGANSLVGTGWGNIYIPLKVTSAVNTGIDDDIDTNVLEFLGVSRLGRGYSEETQRNAWVSPKIIFQKKRSQAFKDCIYTHRGE